MTQLQRGYVDRDSHLCYHITQVGEEPFDDDYSKEKAYDIPKDLIERAGKAEDEYGEVQELLKKLWEADCEERSIRYQRTLSK